MLRIALCQIRVGANKLKNTVGAVEKIREAAERHARLVVLPECFNCPYGTQHFAEYAEPIVEGPTIDSIRKAALQHQVYVIAGSVPECAPDGSLFNTAVVIGPDGVVLGTFRKYHLFELNSPTVKFREADVLRAGDRLFAFEIPTSADARPPADATPVAPSIRVGVAICFDVRYPAIADIYSRALGTSLLVFPGAFNMVTGPIHWELTGRARAVDSQQFVAMVSPARDTEAGYVAWGHSFLSDPLGSVVGSLDENEGMLVLDIDSAKVASTRAMIPITSGHRMRWPDGELTESSVEGHRVWSYRPNVES